MVTQNLFCGLDLSSSLIRVSCFYVDNDILTTYTDTRARDRAVLHFVLSDMCAEGARNALSLAGTMLGSHTLKVQPSKTVIAPVNKELLPRVSSLVHYLNILV